MPAGGYGAAMGRGTDVGLGAANAFEAGALCLQFLAAPEDLVGWAREVLAVEAVDPPTAQERKDAESLRTAVTRLAMNLVDGRPASIGDIARLNRLAAAPDLPPQIGPGGTRGWPSPVALGQVVATVARDAVDLLTSADAARIKACAADDCDLVFLDSSQPGQRRWCAMARCGNRAKVRAYRARRRAEAAEAAEAAEVEAAGATAGAG